MTTTTLKKHLHKAIDIINDEGFLRAVYTIVNEKTHEYEPSLSPEQWAEIDHRVKLHKAGKSKSYSLEEVVKYAKGNLKK